MLFKVIFAFAAHRHRTEKLQYNHKNFAYLCSIKSKIYTQKSVQNRQLKEINFNPRMPRGRHTTHSTRTTPMHATRMTLTHATRKTPTHATRMTLTHAAPCTPQTAHIHANTPPHAQTAHIHANAPCTPRTALTCRTNTPEPRHKKHNFSIQKETLSNLFYPTVSLLKGELTY